MQTEFCISNTCIDGTKPHQKLCVCHDSIYEINTYLYWFFYDMSNQRNNFIQDEVYDSLEVRAVTVQIVVCCDLTPRGLLDTCRRTGTPAASIVICAAEKVPDFSETLICVF